MQVPTLLMSLQILNKSANKAHTITTIGIILSFIMIPCVLIYFYNKYSSFDKKSFTIKTCLIIILAVVAELLINKFSLPFMKVTGNANVDALQGIANAFPVLMLIYAFIVGPILEELLFRGLFMNLFFVDKPYLSLILSSIIFGALHTSNDLVYLLSKIALGFVLGLVYLKTKNIKANIAVHILNNVSAILFK